MRRRCAIEIRGPGDAEAAMRRHAAGARLGDELFDIFRELGIKPASGCDCVRLRREMNQLGPDGCREQQAGLVMRLQRNAAKYGLGEWASAGWSALWQGKPLSLAGLLDLAIERAAEGNQ
jgi:hypothetical protein